METGSHSQFISQVKFLDWRPTRCGDDKLADPKNAGRVALALNKLGLPELSQVSGRSLAQLSGGLAPLAGKISVAGWVWSGGKAVYDTADCYNKPN